MKVVFLVFVAVFCYDCAADSSKETEENSLITSVLASNLDGSPQLPSLHVLREDRGELVETEAEDIIPAEALNNRGRTIGNGLSSHSIALNRATDNDSSMVKTDVTVNSRTSGEDKVNGNESVNGLIVEDENIADVTEKTTTIRSTTRSRYTYRHKYTSRKQHNNLKRRIIEATTKPTVSSTRTYHRHVFTRNPLSLRNKFVITTTAAPKSVIGEESDKKDGSSTETSTSVYGRFGRNRFRMKPPSAMIRNSDAINTHSNIDSNGSNNDSNSHEPKSTTSIYNKYRKNRPRMPQISMIKTDEIITKAPEEEKVIEDEESSSDFDAEEPSSTTIYEKFRRNRPRMNWRPQTKKNTKIDHISNEEVETSTNIESIDENENPTELPVTTSIYEKYRRSRPRMQPISKINIGAIKTEVQTESKTVVVSNQDEETSSDYNGEEPSSTTIYEKFRRNRHRMNWKPPIKKNARLDHTNNEELETSASIENINENENPTELPVTTSIYEKYRRSRHRMQPISRLNVGTINDELQTERKNESSNHSEEITSDFEEEESPSTTIYEKFRRNRPRMHWRPDVKKNPKLDTTRHIKEEKIVNLEDIDENESQTELPVTTSIYEKYRRNRPRMLPIPKVNTKEVHTEEQAETKIENNSNTFVEDETPTSTTVYEKFRRNRPRMQWRPQVKKNDKIDLTSDEKEEKFNLENIDEDESATELPVSTSIYEKFRRSRPRMLPTSRLNIKATVPETQVERKTEHQLMQMHSNVNNQDDNSHINIEDETPSSTTIYEKFRRNRPRMQRRPHINKHHENTQLHPIVDEMENNERQHNPINDGAVNENEETPVATSIYEKYRRNRFRKLPILPLTISSRIFDEEIDEDDGTNNPIKELKGKADSHTFGVDGNQDLPDIKGESKNVLKRKSRENSSFRTTVQELEEPSEDLFSIVEDHDDSLFETHEPGEEASFFDVETTIIPLQGSSEEITVSLPTSFNIEDKTESSIFTNPDAGDTAHFNVETSTIPSQDPIKEITVSLPASFNIEDKAEPNILTNLHAGATSTPSVKTSTIPSQDPIEKLIVSSPTNLNNPDAGKTSETSTIPSQEPTKEITVSIPTSFNIEDNSEQNIFTNTEETTTFDMETTITPSQETSETVTTSLPTSFTIDAKTEAKGLTNPAELDLESTTPELVTVDPKHWYGVSDPKESEIDENDKVQAKETTSNVSKEDKTTTEAQITELNEIITEEATDKTTTVSIESLEQNDVPKIDQTETTNVGDVDDKKNDASTPDQTKIINNASTEKIEITTITNDLPSSSITTELVSTNTIKISTLLPIATQKTSTTESTIISTEIDNINTIVINEHPDETLDDTDDDVIDPLADNITDTKEHEDLTSLMLDDNYNDEEYDETHHIYKIPPVHKPQTTTKKPVISGSILGKKTNLTIELTIKNRTIDVPSNVTVQEDPLNPGLTFTWSPNRDTNYTMSLNLSKGASNYYEINSVEIYAVKDGNVSVWKKNDSIRADEENEEQALIVDVADDVKILFSDRKFLKMSVESRNEDVESEASEATEQLKTYYLEICLGVLALVFFLALLLYIIIRKLKIRYIREQNKLPTESNF
ncbi:unnamed protein product [Phyllotreta striolata]|uniref:Uncharacterized protein n=1 Tax=Phyllotreta striolata TaxID=444603 RepID=A0A9N9XUE1_PHYSR|nr:unnamed protein product [Phyllotreta striolata]